MRHDEFIVQQTSSEIVKPNAPTGVALICAAFLLALDRHRIQLYGDLPYIVHLFDVQSILVEYGYGEYPNLLAAAWLHDVIEDTPTNYATVKETTNGEVAEIVYACSDELGRSRKERKKNNTTRKNMTYDAITVKLADWIANVRDAVKNKPESVGMYRKDWPEFREMGQDPRYLCDRHVVMWAELEKLLHCTCRKKSPCTWCCDRYGYASDG